MKSTLLLLLLLLLFISVPKAEAYDAEPFAVSLEINTYIETKIVVSYAFTQNVTSDAYSAGKSVWQVNIDPLVTSFITSAADKFTWHLTVAYDMVVAQGVTIAVFSGDEPVDTAEFDVETNQLTLDFSITVTEQPKYPTAEELADKSIEVLENKFAEYVAEMRRQNELSREHDTMQWVIVGITFLGFVAHVLVPYAKMPKQEEEE